MGAVTDAGLVLGRIRERGYWQIVIRPTAYRGDRVPYEQLETVMRDCTVRLRGWDYPHFDREGPSPHIDHIQSGTDWANHKEVWRFYQSGQFVHFLALREDWADEHPSVSTGQHPSPRTVLGYELTLYTLTEVFLFAAKLTERCAFGPKVHVEYRLHELRDREIHFYNPNRVPFSYPRRTQMPTWERSVEAAPERLIVEAPAIAAAEAMEIFKRFGWTPSTEQLAQEQRKFLEQRI